MKILIENFRKFLTEERTNQEKIYQLLSNDDLNVIAQGMQLAPIG